MATLEQAYKMAHEAYTKHDYQRAESVCVQILNQVDGHPETQYLLGHIKKNRRQIDEAREIFEGLLRDDTKNPDILCSLGTLEETVGRYDTALSFFKRALDINANLETAQFLYASMLERTNQIDEAETYIKSIAIRKALSPQMQLLYASILCQRKQFEEAIELLTKLKDKILAPPAISQKYFTLGQCYDGQQDYERAFKALSKANNHKTKPANNNADKKRFLSEIESYRAILPALKHEEQAGDEDIQIHFMVGFPRSGTTLLHHMLDAHPQISVISELPLMQFLLNNIQETHGEGISKIPSLSDEQIAELKGLYIHFLKDYLKKFEGNQAFSKDTIYIDKLPLNIIHAGLIHRLFPNAKFLLSLRHPCDVAISNFMQNYQPNSAMDNMNNLGDIAHAYRESFDLFHETQDQCAFDVCNIRYEDIIDNFETESRKACDFLGIDYADEIKTYRDRIQKGKSINTPSYNQIIKPLYPDSRQRWKNYENYIAPHIDSLLPYIEKFGYKEE